MIEMTFLNQKQHCQVTLLPGRYLLGSNPSEVPDREFWPEDLRKIVIEDAWVACEQMLLTLNEAGNVEIQNMGRPVLLPSGRRIKSEVPETFAVPSHFSIGKTRFSLQPSEVKWVHDDTLTTITRRLADRNVFLTSKESTELETQFLKSPPAADTLIHWFDSLNQLQRSTVGSREFFENAVQCVLDPGGLDLGLILTRGEDTWEIAASHVPFPEAGFSFRRDLVKQVINQKRLWFHLGCEEFCSEDEFSHHWVVAAPVLDQVGDVVAVLYGARFENPYNNRHGIRPLEAHYIRMVADTVSSAMTRVQAEVEVARSQVLLEQSFSPVVVEALQRDPDLLQSKECEVTVLFADLRQFSKISESVGALTTHHLLHDLLEKLTEIVEKHSGVVIDYYGDGLAAFWNAPISLDDHAWHACHAALELQRQMEEINATWQPQLGRPLQIGIGIHTGIAQVGNSGCQRKVKYGPRGHAVNLASRLESATKHFQVPILLSGETASAIKDRMMTMRICKTMVPGIRQSIDIYQLVAGDISISKLKFIERYHDALSSFEGGRHAECLQQLCGLLQEDDVEFRVDYLLGQLELAGNREGWCIPDMQQRLWTRQKPAVDEKLANSYAALANDKSEESSRS